MKARLVNIEELIVRIDAICEQTRIYEKKYDDAISAVDTAFSKSALNLVHYLALRSNDIGDLQKNLSSTGLSSLSKVEGHVLASLCTTRNILRILAGKKEKERRGIPVSLKEADQLLKSNTRALFGSKSKERKTRIMVTLPREAAENYRMVYGLISNGMNVARINCAHDNEKVWKKIIFNIKKAEESLGKTCKIVMDLGGPRLRTGPMTAGPKVIHLMPQLDDLGRVIKPALVWLATEGSLPPAKADAFIPVTDRWLHEIRKGDEILFTDARNKPCRLKVIQTNARSALAHSTDSAYIVTGIELNLKSQRTDDPLSDHVGELMPLEQSIILKKGDILILHAEPSPGEPAGYDGDGKMIRHPHISCSLPEVFKDVKPDEPILFDDGKIEGIIKEVSDLQLLIEITFARETGSKLRADKGINLPASSLTQCGLTSKDRDDIRFITRHADVINFSFVNGPEDVDTLLHELKRLKAKTGVILKIETKKGFQNLPWILLAAMRTHPVGIMIARGDMAIECGWKEMARMQNEILRLCEAAHVPNIYATQVLERLAKKGMPSRAEIIDAAISQQAECVMLNNGPYIIPAIRMLDKILRITEKYQEKQSTLLPKIYT
jgi:pyruvate kinase